MGVAMMVNKKMLFATLMSHMEQFEAHLIVKQMSRSAMAILVVMTDTQKTTDKPIALPLVHARGVLILHVVYNHIKSQRYACIFLASWGRG